MKPERKILGRLIKIAAVCFLALAGLVVFFLFFITLPPGENLIKGYLEKQLKAVLHKEVRIGHLETNLLSSLLLTDIKIYDAAPSSPDTIADISQLEIEYSLTPLLRRELYIDAVRFDNVSLALHRDSLGRFEIFPLDSLIGAPPDTATPEPGMTVNLRSVSVEGLSLHYIDDSLQTKAAMNGFACRVEQGETDRYDFTLSVDGINAVYDNLPVSLAALSTSGKIDEKLLTVYALTGMFENMPFKSDGALSIDAPYTARFDMNLTGDPAALLKKIQNRYDTPPVEISDNLNIDLSLSGDLDKPKIRAALHPLTVNIDDLTVHSSNLYARWTGDSLWLDTFRLETFDGWINGSGRFRLDTLTGSQANLEISNIDLASVWSRLYRQESPYTGKIDGSVTVEGSGDNLSDWSVTAALRSRQLRYHTQPLPDFHTDFHFENSRANLKISQENFLITADADVTNEIISGRFTADIVQLQPLADFFNVPDLKGTLQVKGTVSGKTNSPKVLADVNGHDILYRNFPVDSFWAELRYRDSLIDIKRLSFEGALEDINPAHPPFYVDSLTGGFSYRGNLSGTFDKLKGGIDIALKQLQYGSYGLDSGYIRVALDNGRAQLAGTRFFKDLLRAELDGVYNLETNAGTLETKLFGAPSSLDTASDDITITPAPELIPAGVINSTFNLADTGRIVITAAGRNIDLSRFRPFLTDTVTINGDMTFDLAFTGTADRPAADLMLIMKNISYARLELDSLKSAVFFKNDFLRIAELRAYGYKQELTAEGGVQLKKDTLSSYTVADDSRLKGSVQITRLDLAALNSLSDGKAEFTGAGSAAINWDGTFLNPHLKGWFALDSGTAVLNAGVDTVSAINLHASIQDSLITLESARALIKKNPLQLTGTAVISERERLKTDLHLSIEDISGIYGRGLISRETLAFECGVDSFELSLAQPFVPDLAKLSGTLDGLVNLTGSPDNPRLDGYINIRQLLFQPALLNSPFREGIVKIRFDQTRVDIDSVFTLFNDGRMFLTGHLAYRGLEIKDINIKLAADSITYTEPKEYQVNLRSARLSYTKPNEYFLLAGDIELGESKLTANFKPQSILPWAREIETPVPELPEIVQQTRMDIRLRESDRLWVDNNLARLRLHSELGIIGGPAQPNFSGRITVEEGYLLYLDRKFKVQQGNIFFSDPLRFNPEINLKADASVTSYRAMSATPYVITFTAEGLLDELVVSLYSEPPLDKPDIVSLLTLGATRSQLTGKDSEGKSGTKNILIERAQVLSSKKVSGYVSRKVGTLFGLDQVSVEGNLFRFDKTWGPQLLASKKLSNRVEMTYTTTVGHINDQSIRLDYQLSRRFLLMGQTDRQGNSGLDLKFRLRFK
ncbi:MAG: translocation/assembly module TamB domain-containing protein [candidate division Zixibacteria bacterium]|nr:translocation/assembly module TamB domain-containing protein [candidate division Zixibacteria bacterium]